MMKRICRSYLKTALEEYDAALEELIAATDEMMENIGQPLEVYDGTWLRQANDVYKDKVLGLADAIRFTLEMER
ncbi:MAG: hypothetical protein IJ616_08995 [Bacteroidales bacterium]|nr:hypothetical protein [Bacteroidales bacterium]